MAIPGRGILDNFSGKLGTVIGGSWKGIPYMRSLPRYKRNRTFSEAQLAQHAKFELATRFMRSFTSLFNASFKQVNSKTARNAVLKNLLTNAIGGIPPNLYIDYSKVEVAQGSLNVADNPLASSPSAGRIRFNWTDSSGLGNAKAEDKAILVVYSPDKNLAIYTVNGATRNTQQDELDVSYFSGLQVFTWIAFRTADGKLTSNSLPLGLVQVL